MAEENYLEKLKSIREKYHSQSSYDYRANTEIMYPLSQKVEERHHHEYQHKEIRTPQRNYLQVSPSRRDKIRLDLNRDRPSLDKRWERSATIDKTRGINYDQLRTPMLSEAQLRRQDNFNHFISDLDKRIDEKEKKLSLKFKQNERVIRHFEQAPKEYQSQRMQRHASTRDIRREYVQERPQLAKKDLDFLPRSAYDKSKSYKNYENAENDHPRYYKGSPSKYRTIDEYKKHHFPSSTQAMLSNKLDGPLNLSKYGKDGWNPSKLESIQNRIQSVLKQCNR